MKTLSQWLSEYGESHQNETNKLIHWICVPLIFFSVLAMLYSIKLPWVVKGYQLNVGVILAILVLIYYASLSISLSIGMLLFIVICLWFCFLLEQTNTLALWQFALIIFVLAWIGQFYGHKVEGAKPSFFKDLQFLMIGPAWLMSFVYKKLGIGV
ncbi:MAG: Mpo1-like protein [Ferruginibacter sp.]